MVMIRPRLLAVLILLPLALYLLSQRYDPQRPSGRILQRITAGAALLTAWNLLTGQTAGINPLSSYVTGLLGLPGAGLMALLTLLSQQV